MTVAEIYEKDYNIFIRYAMKHFTRFNEEWARDLVQDTFLRVLRYLKSTGKSLIEGTERTFIIGVMHHVVINNYRCKHNKMAKRCSDLAEVEKVTIDHDFNLDIDIIHKVLQGRSSENKTYQYFLKYLQGYKLKEIAEMENTTIQSVKSGMNFCRQRAIKSKVISSMVAVYTAFLLIGCNPKDCPDCPSCPPCNPITIHDTVIVDNTCYPCIDSAKQVALEEINDWYLFKVDELDSLHQLAMNEVDEYREQAIYEIDTMRENFIIWRDAEVEYLALWKDSVERLHIYDNLTIDCPEMEAIVYFDEVTGKPVLKILE